MPSPTKGPRLGGGPAHQRLMLANLATALFEHGRIRTTEAKARRLRPVAERLITFAKRGDLHARRQVLTVVRDKGVVHELFTEIGPRYANRPGGYTRITKIGFRRGDNAPLAVIELVEPLTVSQQAVGEAERARGTQFAGSSGSSGAPGSAAAAAGTGTPAASEPTSGPAPAVTAAPQGSVESPPGAGPGGGAVAMSEAGQGGTAPGPEQAGTTGSEPAPEAGDLPAEGATSPQTQGAGQTEQAEGDSA